jgi:hypothetical protein
MNHRLLMVTAVAWALSLVGTPIMAQQAVEGTGKILTAPVEVPKGTVEGARTDAPIAGAVGGTVKGTGKAVKQTGQGTADVVEGTGKAVGDTLRVLTGEQK